MGIGGQIVAGFVKPVRSNAVVRHRLHFFSTYLNFDRHAMHAEKRGVQRLIAVRFGDGDVVLESAGDRFIQIVNGTQHAITGVYRVNNDAKGIDIHDVRERLAFDPHLFIDTVEMLFPTDRPAREAFAFKAGFQ